MSKGPLKILHVITGLNVGGAESMLASLVKASASQKVVHRVATLLPGGVLVPRIEASETPVECIDATSARHAPGAALRLAALIRAYEPHIVQGWLYHGDLAALVGLTLSGRRSRTRLVWSLRCSDMDLGLYSHKLRAVFRTCVALSSWPDTVVSNSVAGLAAHIARGYRPRSMHTIQNGIDIDRYKPDAAARLQLREQLGIPEQAPVVVHVGRVDPMKDHECFLTAMSALPDVTAIAVGLGTEHLPDRPNLHRLGRRDDVEQVMAAGDFIVSTSAFGEGFSNTVAEGMACGLPAIATDVGDARAIIGDTGTIVPARAPGRIAGAIRNLLGEAKELRVSRSRAARSRIVENFTIERATHDFTALYHKLAGMPAG